ncbi:hypothetical protein D3C80_1723500 [compost metagenome]
MPHRQPVEPLVLQHQHRIAGGHFAQHIFQSWSQRVDQHALLPRRCHQLDAQAALASGQVDPLLQLPWSHPHATLVEHGGKRCRAALKLLLREELNIAQLYTPRQPGDFRR